MWNDKHSAWWCQSRSSMNIWGWMKKWTSYRSRSALLLSYIIIIIVIYYCCCYFPKSTWETGVKEISSKLWSGPETKLSKGGPWPQVVWLESRTQYLLYPSIHPVFSSPKNRDNNSAHLVGLLWKAFWISEIVKNPLPFGTITVPPNQRFLFSLSIMSTYLPFNHQRLKCHVHSPISSPLLPSYLAFHPELGASSLASWSLGLFHSRHFASCQPSIPWAQLAHFYFPNPFLWRFEFPVPLGLQHITLPDLPHTHSTSFAIWPLSCLTILLLHLF